MVPKTRSNGIVTHLIMDEHFSGAGMGFIPKYSYVSGCFYKSDFIMGGLVPIISYSDIEFMGL